MKLIVKICLVILSLSIISCARDSAFQKNWCGNSKVDIEISTGIEIKVITKASIVVPSTLTEIGTYQQTSKLIKKTEQGLVLTLDGAANPAHLGKIYNYDEDDNTQIFIPYLYISAINRNTGIFNVLMARTFKGPGEFKFNIVPVPDAFGTNLCPCQLEMLQDRIKQNLTKRIAVLSSISSRIVTYVNEVVFYTGEIKKWTDLKINQEDLKNLQTSKTNKVAECKAFNDQIKTLNGKVTENVTTLSERNAKSQIVCGEIRRIENELGYSRWAEVELRDANKYTMDLWKYADNGFTAAYKNLVTIENNFKDYNPNLRNNDSIIKTVDDHRLFKVQAEVGKNFIITKVDAIESSVKALREKYQKTLDSIN